MLCPNCNREVGVDSSFCPGCGTNLSVNGGMNISRSQISVDNSINNASASNINQNYNIPNNNQNKNNNTVLIIIIIIAFIALLVIGGIVVVPFVVKQINLNKVDSELRDEIGDINNILDNDKTNQDQSNDEGKVQYKVGDAVKLLDDSSWHVISIDGDNVTLLSDTLAKENSGYGNSASANDQKYENSIIKEYLENTYLPSLKNSLQNNNGDIFNLKIRLITVEEYLKLTGAKFHISSNETISECWFTDNKYYDFSNANYSEAPAYLALTSSYWTMDNYKDYVSNNTNCNGNNGYYGAYYIEITTSAFDDNSGRVQLTMDNHAIGGGDSYGTLKAVRPVIETTIKNLK